ncbi:hypothetical protein FOZ63_014404 [Perkinsus olseni]|uniref:Uncharacterized protein n=1 Tax=Perkinsus olseni TaxID=32597 RepID=A0A7J6R651_PEROL|nr:hypothetical protein FOZ63_014404 [Perkinsus olseni]
MSADNDGAKDSPPSGGPPPTISHTSLPDEVLKALQAIPFLKNIAPGMAKIFAETPIDGDTLLQIDSQEDLMIIMEGTGITNRQATLLQAKIKQRSVSPKQDPNKQSRGRIKAKNQQTQALTKPEPQRRALHHKQSQETPQA